MAARKYKFVSPGVFLREVDNSQLPKLPGNVGPVIIGRTRKGPALRPVTVNSYADFVEVFGEPVPGNQGDDVWRDGNGHLAPAYAHYAAKAYLSANIASPVTVVRLLGVKGDNAEDTASAGWASNNAVGLFVYPSGAIASTTHKLAAIFYGDSGMKFQLKGKNLANADSTASGVVTNDVTNGEFELFLSASAARTKSVKINFTKGSKNYIRSVLNTNPVMSNEGISHVTSGTLADKYWLGETFEENVPSGDLVGYTAALSTSGEDFDDYSHEATAARTGWIIAQDEGVNSEYNALTETKLFRMLAISEGESFSKEIVPAIEDIRVPQTGDADPYGSFTVTVRKKIAGKLEVVESFPGCNLNPNSSNYVARQVGDQYFSWSSTEKRNKVYGNYPNQSRYIRIDMKSNVDAGLVSPSKVPFGFLGPIIPKDESYTLSGGSFTTNGKFLNGATIASSLTADASSSFTVEWPRLPNTVSGSIRGADYFGASVYKVSNNSLSSEIDPGYIDYIRSMPVGTLRTDQIAGVAGNNSQHAFTFSLDELRILGTNLTDSYSANVTASFYLSGSRADSTSFTHAQGNGINTMLELGFDKFQMPLVGGFDGVDITQPDPFANRITSGQTAASSYAYASIERAIELIRDPETLEHNIAVMPGITTAGLTSKLVDTCEARADSLAIIDLPDVYKPAHELKCTEYSDRIPSTPEKVSKALKARQINSSYGAAYYPWVKIKDVESSRDVWVPPSVVALGVMAYTEQRDEVWFAPAGFNRGGLNEGNAGVPVLQVSEQLLSKQRDVLYETNINPIASFVTEGLVIFGQKTLQSTPSALDRINVRRLLIFVKKEVSRIANGLLFDQNVPATWNRFLGQVNPLLQSVKTRLGLSDFKVILDNTTTTPDLVDRNVMYAKIFLKPARSIEFIAVDFVITNTGASFDD